MGRYLLWGLLVLAFGALNALAAENLEKLTAVGLGEVCDKKIGPLCKSGINSQYAGAWQGRSMRERHGTRTGRTDNTATRSVKFKRRKRRLASGLSVA